jgi:acetyl-CoA C-acetyltransferase
MSTVISSIARTPIGKFRGAFSPLSAMDLGGAAIAGALERAGITGDAIDEVLFGHVIQAGQGQLTSRQAALAGGIPLTVPSTTINKVCLSGMETIADASFRIAVGESQIVMTGGMESMTNAPYLLEGARMGLGYGDVVLQDTLDQDGLSARSTIVSWASPPTRRTSNTGSDGRSRTPGPPRATLVPPPPPTPAPSTTRSFP